MQNSKIEESARLAEYIQNSLVSGLDEDQYQIKKSGRQAGAVFMC